MAEIEDGSKEQCASAPRYVVVYVEDNSSSVALMKDLLADFDGVELHCAPTAEIGIELVRQHRPQVVLMDINLPGMNGIEAAHRLKTWPETHDIPVIALSAAALSNDGSQVQPDAFYRYLTKPVQVDQLVELLEALLTETEPRPPLPER